MTAGQVSESCLAPPTATNVAGAGGGTTAGGLVAALVGAETGPLPAGSTARTA